LSVLGLGLEGGVDGLEVLHDDGVDDPLHQGREGWHVVFVVEVLVKPRAAIFGGELPGAFESVVIARDLAELGRGLRVVPEFFLSPADFEAEGGDEADPIGDESLTTILCYSI
jgi:hypothetical protein